jgi:cyclic pyranopterin phosphate synthase
MPEEGMQWLPKSAILSYEEIHDVVAQLAPLGLRRLRITGGEPTIRPQIHELVRMLRADSGDHGHRAVDEWRSLPEIAPLLREAGLDRVNMSVDSLRAERIAVSPVATSALIRCARRAPRRTPVSGPIKLNMVVMRGINDDEIEAMARLTIDHPWHVRFIELMPVGDLRALTWNMWCRATRFSRVCARSLPSRRPPGRHAGTDRRVLQWADAAGSIGVITPMTHTYCASCNRVRLTADGRCAHVFWRPRGGSSHAAPRGRSHSKRHFRARSPRSRRSTSCCR